MQGARNPDTRIVLSIAFVDYAEPIVDAQEMKPLDDELPDYTSVEPARCTLEVNRGFFGERSVEVGDKAELPVWFSPGVRQIPSGGFSEVHSHKSLALPRSKSPVQHPKTAR